MNRIAKLLFNRHTHAEIAHSQNPEQIVYTEESVIDILRILGFNKPNWKQKKGDILEKPCEKCKNRLCECA